MALILSILLGFLPMLFFSWVIYWMDRYEKEPIKILGGVFLWGALVAAGSAFIINTVLGIGIYIFTGSEAATDFTTSSVIAPFIEEILKGGAVLIVFLFFRYEFDSILDGIVYAAITALGFAASENVFYIYEKGYVVNGFHGLIWLTFVRVVLVGWQHPFYTSFSGIGLAVSRLNKNTLIKLIAPLTGLGVAIFAHAMHNIISELLSGFGGLLLGTMIDWVGWSFMLLFIIWAIKHEQKFIINQLKDEIALGILSERQYITACSAKAQGKARWSAFMAGKFGVTNRFYQLCSELAYKKHQNAQLGTEDGDMPLIISLRSEISRLSSQVDY